MVRAAVLLLRSLAVVGGGYLSAALAVAAGAGLLARLGMARGEAVVLAAMAGFVLYLALLLWAFGSRGVAAADRTFRLSMAWLHTWAGVVLGGVLFVVFWTGTLCVFDREIDRWMMPATRLPSPPPVSLDRVAQLVQPAVPAGASQWRVDLPTDRVPVLRFVAKAGKDDAQPRHIDPVRLAFLPDPGTLGATGFIFPFHYGLHLKWNDVGKWIVGTAAMGMLVLLVSGVIVHRKLFAQFFTFRPRKRLQRSALDLHNMTGVLALPFHATMALSGLVIFMTIYFPQAHSIAYGEGKQAKDAFTEEAYGKFSRRRANAPGTLASLDGMGREAERLWGGGRPYFVRVWHPGDAASYVELRRSYAHDVTMNLDQIYFDAASGAVLHRFEAAPVMTFQRFVSGLHFVQFRHWPLRWLYFCGGLAGCTMIATGFVFWLEARRASHARKGLAGVRIVEGIAVGSITGIVIATLVLFAANRLLPAGDGRADLEVWAFFLGWAAAYGHGWWRASAAWREQAGGIALLAVTCVVLDGVTTAAYPWHAAALGMDAVLVALAALAVWARKRLPRRVLAAVALPVVGVRP